LWGESGSSMTALTELAHKKGYALLTNVACNVIFVDKKYLHLFYEKEPLVDEVYTYESFALIDLTLSEAKRKGLSFFIKKAIRLPWHFLKSLRTKN